MKRMNKWKKLYSCVLAVCLIGTLVLANQSFGVFAEKTEEEATTEQTTEQGKTTVESTEEEKTTQTIKSIKKKSVATQNLENDQEDTNQEIVFDLAKGEIVFKADKTFSGYDSKGQQITGQHSDSNMYKIIQSNAAENATTNTIVIETQNLYSENINPVNENSIYNINLDGVRIDCSGKESIPDGTPCEDDVTDSHYYRTLKQQLNYYQNNRIFTPFLAGDDTVSVNITLSGDNYLYAQKGAQATLQYAHYPMGKNGNGKLTIKGEGNLTVKQPTDGSVNRGACIGGPMLYKTESKNGRSGNGKLIFKSGSINVETNERSYSSAIGGGSCSPAEMPIIFCGSHVTVKSFHTSAAIGAGGGSSGIGESAHQIEIQSGEITVYSPEDGVGIGGGTSDERSGGEAKNIKISGGEVTVYGPDETSYGMIGGGTSHNLGGQQEERNGGAANISISGGNVIAGSIGGGSTNAPNAKGGNATIEVSDNANIKTDSIGGGKSEIGTGGNASVIVKGGYLNISGTIGGGDSNAGKGGDASINVSGGILDCASIGGGNSQSGTPGSVTSSDQSAGVIVTGGTLKSGIIGGGTNNKRDIGFATANISGGDIQGQFILSNTDNDKQCKFTMTGGTIDNKELTNETTSKYKMAQENGGAVYLSDSKGLVDISGGTIKNAKAELGGAIYMKAGTFNFSDKGAIFDCSAKQGGAVYLENGKVAISGGTIGAIINNENHANTATEGGGIYMAGGNMEVSGGRIGYNTADNGAGAYLKAGDMKISNGATIEHNTSKENGAGAYLAGGGLTISGGQITANKATQNGGGAYLQKGNMTVLGGQISNNAAQNGAGTYLEQGNLSINGNGSLLSNTATQNGGGAYLKTGKLTLDSGSIDNNTAQTGGGSYLEGGKLLINGGSVSGNKAENGGGAYVADSIIKMFGGNMNGNKADKNGGAFYVSSKTKPADVLIRSGRLTNNTAGNSTTSDQGNGGAIAVISDNKENKDHVIIGLRHKHEKLDLTTRKFTAFDYEDEQDDNTPHHHESCPEITENQAFGNGGGIYMNSSQSILDIYCLLENNNVATKDPIGASIMSEGGNVNIGDTGENGEGNNTADAVGNIFIQSPMLVKGGNVKIYGNTDNPKFKDKILVNIQKNAGSFNDYRFTKVSGDTNYKIEYFENFEDSGAFTSIQYKADDDIVAMGNMYTHEGYKIVGWNTLKNGTETTGTMYKIGTSIATKDDHSAWDEKQDTEALRLYAIWKKISYTVKYDPNANNYSGAMNLQKFQYGEVQELTSNKYKVRGKHFLEWNTEPDGSGKTYKENYSESKMINADGETVTLYAQWVDCTHKGGDHPGQLSYKADEKRHTITETCDCEGHTAIIQISAADVYYDEKAHPASLSKPADFLAGDPTIVYQYKETADGTYGDMPNNTTEPTQVGYYKATITIDGQSTSVEYEIKSPAEAATIDVAATPGQYFHNFTKAKSCVVAGDDAFTVQYDVQGLNKASENSGEKAYTTAPVLTLNRQLPEGTTIIMQTESSYWYQDNPSGTEIQLTSFKKMGNGNEEFTYNTSDVKDAQKYRFIINFSNVANEKQLNENTSLEIGLKYKYAASTEGGTSTSTDKEEKAQISIGQASSFTAVTLTGNNAVTITAPSNITDTKWARKNLVWKITTSDSNKKLPSDAKLTLSATVNGQVKTAIYLQNEKGEFIIPFSWAESQNFTFALSSEQEAQSSKSYTLIAALCVGNKNNGAQQPEAIEDSMQKASSELTLTVPATTKPSLKISGTQQRVFTKNENLKVNIKYENVENCSIKAIIQKKDNNEYQGKYSDQTIEEPGEYSFGLQATDDAGSYRLLITVSTREEQKLLEVPYYFIIQ